MKTFLIVFWQQFKKQTLVVKTSIIVLLVGVVFILGGGGGLKPSVCDCNDVMLRIGNSSEASKRIIGTDRWKYSSDPIGSAQNECYLKYHDDIVKWQQSKGYTNTTSADEALGFFADQCK